MAGDANLYVTAEVTDGTTAAVVAVMGVGDCGDVSVSCAHPVPNRRPPGAVGSHDAPTHQRDMLGDEVAAANGASQDVREGARPFHNNTDRSDRHMSEAEEGVCELVEISQVGTIPVDKSCVDAAADKNHVGVVVDDNHVGVAVGVRGVGAAAERQEADVPTWTDAVSENDVLASTKLTLANSPSPALWGVAALPPFPEHSSYPQLPYEHL